MPQPYYSDNGVDSAIEKMLPDVGFAVDVGANNGSFASNTLMLEEKGWTVLCVEANPLLEEEGRKIRKLWRAVAAGSEDTTATFHRHGGPPYASNSGFFMAGGEPVDVPMLRLDRILEEAGFSRLDLMTADVEGYEDQVMAGFTVERWKPKVIVLESWNDNQATPSGYTRIHRCQFDNIYLRNEPEAV